MLESLRNDIESSWKLTKRLSYIGKWKPSSTDIYVQFDDFLITDEFDV